MSVKTDQGKCIGCGACVSSCPVSAISIVNNYAKVDDVSCIDCGACINECPSDAISHEDKKSSPEHNSSDDIHHPGDNIDDSSQKKHKNKVVCFFNYLRTLISDLVEAFFDIVLFLFLLPIFSFFWLSSLLFFVYAIFHQTGGYDTAMSLLGCLVCYIFFKITLGFGLRKSLYTSFEKPSWLYVIIILVIAFFINSTLVWSHVSGKILSYVKPEWALCKYYYLIDNGDKSALSNLAETGQKYLGKIVTSDYKYNEHTIGWATLLQNIDLGKNEYQDFINGYGAYYKGIAYYDALACARDLVYSEECLIEATAKYGNGDAACLLAGLYFRNRRGRPSKDSVELGLRYLDQAFSQGSVLVLFLLTKYERNDIQNEFKIDSMLDFSREAHTWYRNSRRHSYSWLKPLSQAFDIVFQPIIRWLL